MYTSYFAHPGIKADPNAVSIARFTPRWWGKGRRYIALAPSAQLLKEVRSGLSWSVYTQRYIQDVLSHLDPARIYAELEHSILVCYERPDEHCHRRLVAEWIERALGVTVPEL